MSTTARHRERPDWPTPGAAGAVASSAPASSPILRAWPLLAWALPRRWPARWSPTGRCRWTPIARPCSTATAARCGRSWCAKASGSQPGQPLVVLDDARIDAAHDLAQQPARCAPHPPVARWPPRAGRRRAGSCPTAFGARHAEPRVAEAAARESALFAARRSALDAQARLRARAARRGGAARRPRASASTRRCARATASMQEEVQVNEPLLEQRFVNRTRVLRLQRDAAEYQSSMDENAAELARRQRSAPS